MKSKEVFVESVKTTKLFKLSDRDETKERRSSVALTGIWVVVGFVTPLEIKMKKTLFGTKANN